MEPDPQRPVLEGPKPGEARREGMKQWVETSGVSQRRSGLSRAPISILARQVLAGVHGRAPRARASHPLRTSGGSQLRALSCTKACLRFFRRDEAGSLLAEEGVQITGAAAIVGEPKARILARAPAAALSKLTDFSRNTPFLAAININQTPTAWHPTPCVLAR